jgi:arylsulfatase A-like enzyme
MQLRQAGYFTGYIGKNHVPLGPKGYESGLMEQSYDYWYGGHQHLGFYPKERHRIFRSAKPDTQVEILQEASLAFLDSTGDFVASADTFLKRRPADKPFCLSISFNVPHGAGTSSMKLLPTDPELYRTGYRDRLAELPLPSNYIAKADLRTPKLPGEVLYAAYRQTEYKYVDAPDTLRERMVRQYQTVTGVDQLVGQVRERLRQLGLAENTIIIFTSDHGLMLGEFGLGGKALNYERCLNVPLLVLDPRQPAARRNQRLSQLVQSIDLAPTLLELAGVPVPATMQGRSLVPLVEGRPAAWREYAFAENLWSTVFGNPRIESVRSDRWKYIRYFKNDRTPWQGLEEGARAYEVGPEQARRYHDWLTASIRGEQPVYEELFDVRTDPNETTNLANRPDLKATLGEQRRQCERLVAEAKGGVVEPPLSTVLPPPRKRNK